MTSKRFKKLPKDTANHASEGIEKLLPTIKKNCTTKFDESIDLSFQINNKQKKSEINLRTVVNLPAGSGKKIKVAVVCEETKSQIAKDAGADIVGGVMEIGAVDGQSIEFLLLRNTPKSVFFITPKHFGLAHRTCLGDGAR